jgi:hypothetical protein
MRRARISSLLGKIAVLFVICFFGLPAQGKYGGGSGTAEEPYLIYDEFQMNTIGANQGDWSMHFLLCADIDLSGFTGKSFNIIGNSSTKFRGVFDGNGHTISNFTYMSNDKNHVGLFGYVKGGEIKNLGLIATNINAGAGWYVGSLVGYLLEGTINNCYVQDIHISGTVYVGGLVGYNDGTISNCCSYSIGAVLGDSAGGLAGYNLYGIISNCYSTVKLVGNSWIGGLVGCNWYGTISNCYSSGSVTGNHYVGGLVGYNQQGRVFGSYWDTETSGQATSAGGIGKTTIEMQTASTFVGWGCDLVWTIDDGNDYPRLWWENMPGASITIHSYCDGSGTVADPYLIYTAEQYNIIGLIPCHWDKHFKLMANIDLAGFNGTSFNIIGISPWLPFTGVFDGNDYAISNFNYASTVTEYIGLFGYIEGENAEIKNLRLVDPHVDAGKGDYVGSMVGRLREGTITVCYVEGGSVEGNNHVGGLMGDNDEGSITNCYVDGGIVAGNEYVGGLVGYNEEGTITNCYSNGSTKGRRFVGGLVGYNIYGTFSDCYQTSGVLGDENVGGLVGINDRGTITNCYSTGSVAGNYHIGGLVGKSNHGTITHSYSTGSVPVGGGLVGYNVGEITYSFWDIETSGQTSSDGGTGLSTAQMQTISTFTDAGWDFVGETFNGIEDIWFIPQGDYPHLWWEGMEVPMKLTPRTLNCRSEGNWVKAHIILPEGFTVADVDSNRPAVLHSYGFQSTPLNVFINKNKVVEIEAPFERQAVCSLTDNWPQDVTVAGFLADGNIFLGTSTVRIIHPGMKVIGELASYWLNAGCVHPDFCDGIDMNRDSLVNLLDYALLMNNKVEFVTYE